MTTPTTHTPRVQYWKDSHTGDGAFEPTGINNKPAPQISNKDTVCGFLLYRSSATPNGSGWDISDDFALPAMHQGQFCVSASFMDNPAVWLVNAERYTQNDGLPASDLDNTNYIVVGANNPTFQYDNGLSRCTFKNLHIPKVLGVEDMPTKDGEVVQTTLGNWVVKVYHSRHVHQVRVHMGILARRRHSQRGRLHHQQSGYQPELPAQLLHQWHQLRQHVWYTGRRRKQTTHRWMT